MTERERFLNTLLYRPVDRRPLYLYPPWRDTLERWYGEGLPRGTDVNAFLRYKKVMDFARAHGVELAWCDTDGDVRGLLPLFLEAGCNITGPCEVAAGMTPVDLRRRFGKAQRMIGGLDKREIARGRDAIDAELARNLPVLREGGFVPAIDHSVSSDISFDTYRYFIDALRKALVEGGRING